MPTPSNIGVRSMYGPANKGLRSSLPCHWEEIPVWILRSKTKLKRKEKKSDCTMITQAKVAAYTVIEGNVDSFSIAVHKDAS